MLRIHRDESFTDFKCQIGKKRVFALEGSVFVGGAVVQWLRDGLQLVRSAKKVDLLAEPTPDNGGVYLVPAFTGLGAPHWDAYARGMIIGITRDTSAAHIARASLEGVAFQVADLIDAMHADTGKRLKELRVDGGASHSAFLMQFQADLLQIPVVTLTGLRPYLRPLRGDRLRRHRVTLTRNAVELRSNVLRTRHFCSAKWRP